MEKSNHSLSELDCIKELRKRLDTLLSPKVEDDDNMFIRFLRARNYNLDAAEAMLRNHLIWRESFKVDNILSWYKPNELSKFVPYSFVAYDKEGCLVYFLPMGNIDYRGVTKAYTLKGILSYIVHFLERNITILEEHSRKINKKVEKISFIYDCGDLPLKTATHKPSIDFVVNVISLFEQNYPERLKFVLVYNASFYFQLAFACIKPLITAPIMQKIKIFGKSGYQAELLKLIDSDVLPVCFGGKRTDPDGNPRCITFTQPAVPVPKNLYLTHKKKEFENQLGVKKIIINRLSKKLIELNVDDSDSCIEWEFETKDKDINFCLLFKEFKNSKEEVREVIPKEKIDASFSPEVGLYKCDKSGVYFLEFDNSYSWIYQKEVHYKVKIVPTDSLNNMLKTRSV